MTNRSIIRSLEVSDFRGLEGSRTIDFEGADIVLLLGLNGFGKTSLFDAIEWCFTGKLGRYEQYNEVGRKQDFGKEKEVLRNKYATNPNTFVKVQLDNDKVFGRRVLATGSESDYNAGSIISGCEFGIDTISKVVVNHDLANSYFSATHILSQETINHFVTSKKPEERYQALSVNFGTAIFAPFENNTQILLGMIGDQEKEIAQYIRSKRETVNALGQQVKLKEKEIVSVLIEANSQISELKMLGVEVPIKSIELSNSAVIMEDGVDDKVAKLRSKTSLEYTNKKEIMAGFEWLKNNSEEWIVGNKKLSKLERDISNDRKKLADIDELKKRIRNLNNDISFIKSESETKKLKKANLEIVLEGFSNFKETYNKITSLEKVVLNRNKSISTAKENKDKAEEELKQVKHTISTMSESLRQEEEFLVDINRSEEFLVEYRVAQKKALAEISDFNKNIEDVNSEIAQYEGFLKLLGISAENQLISDVIYGDDKNHLIPSQYLEETRRIIKEIEDDEKGIENIVAKEKELQKKMEDTRSCFTKTRKLLSMALSQIDESKDSQGCPICDTVHSTVKLRDHVERKLGAEESESLKLVEAELKEVQISRFRLEAEAEEAKHELEGTVKKIKVSLSEVLRDKTSQASIFSNSFSNSRKRLEEMERKFEGLTSRFEKKFGRPVQDYADMTSLISEGIKEKKEAVASDRVKERILEEKVSEFQRLLSEGRKVNDETLSDVSSLKGTTYLNILSHIGNLGINPADDTAESDLREMHKNNERDLNTLLEKIGLKVVELREVTEKRNELLGGDSEDEFSVRVVQKGEDISRLKKELNKHLEILAKLGLSPEDYTNKVLTQLIERNETEIKFLEQKFEALEGVLNYLTKIKEYNLDRAARNNILKAERQIESLQERQISLAEVKKELNKLKKDYPKVLKELIKENLDVGLFNRIYELLNPHRRFKMIDFNVDINRNKIGINFNAKHSKIKGRPEFLFSSAQLNTFGICMFLSMALRQNWLDLNTILIDDPIQNLDDINILSLIDFLRGLLDSENDKKQIILSTHDERFYDLMVRKFQNYKIKTFKYESYGKLLPDVLPKTLA